MKITTRRDALFGQLQTVTRAASTRSAVQALSGVQLLAGRDGIELRATDMEIGLRVRGQTAKPSLCGRARESSPIHAYSHWSQKRPFQKP